jgi:succinate--hydroxymethylglutarate CoA-transferase
MSGFVMFRKFKSLVEKVLELPALAHEPRFSTNETRVKNRAQLVQLITDELMKHDMVYWLKRLAGTGCVSWIVAQTSFTSLMYRVPSGPINNVEQTFMHEQVYI